MFKEKVSGVKLPPVEQLGIVVRDIDKAVEYYEATFGWGLLAFQRSAWKGASIEENPPMFG
jgi:predicted enzyme related to lactoylglutathione lyase